MTENGSEEEVSVRGTLTLDILKDRQRGQAIFCMTEDGEGKVACPLILPLYGIPTISQVFGEFCEYIKKRISFAKPLFICIARLLHNRCK